MRAVITLQPFLTPQHLRGTCGLQWPLKSTVHRLTDLPEKSLIFRKLIVRTEEIINECAPEAGRPK
jgi:hypothetical protein